MRKFWTVFIVLFAVVCLMGATRRGTPAATVAVDVSGGGGFSPGSTTIRVNDTVKWRSMISTDNIVQIPEVGPGVDPCTLSEAWPATEEFTGPTREGVAGIFVRGPVGAGDGGPAILDCSEPTCSVNPCANDPAPTTANGRAYCGRENADAYLPDEIWDYSEMSGQLFIIDWDDFETCASATTDDDDPCFDWTRFDHEFDAAAHTGKFIYFAFRAGSEGTPSWLFSAPVNVTPLHLEGTNNNDPGPNSCGTDWDAGSWADPNYVARLNRLIDVTAEHVKSNAAWVQVLQGFQLIGVNAQSDEFKVMYSCPDEDHDGVLDTYNGDACKCNAKTWATVGNWTPEGLVDFVGDQIDRIHEKFWSTLVVRYGLIQDGFPKIQNSTNYEGDTLFDTDGVTRLCPTCVSTDDKLRTPSADLVDDIIAEGRTRAGYAWWVMHFGVDQYGTEDIEHACTQNCSFGGTVNLLASPPQVEFPIPLVAPVAQQCGCPNKWANNTTLERPHPWVTGFQVNNSGNLLIEDDSSNATSVIESIFWNIARNTNAVSLELYTQMLFAVHSLVGSDAEMNPTRDDIPTPAGVDPEVGETLTLNEWSHIFHARRDASVFSNTEVGSAFPSQYTHKFTTPGTYWYYNPRTCSDGVGQYGRIVVVP